MKVSALVIADSESFVVSLHCEDLSLADGIRVGVKRTLFAATQIRAMVAPEGVGARPQGHRHEHLPRPGAASVARDADTSREELDALRTEVVAAVWRSDGDHVRHEGQGRDKEVPAHTAVHQVVCKDGACCCRCC